MPLFAWLDSLDVVWKDTPETPAVWMHIAGKAGGLLFAEWLIDSCHVM